MKGEYQSTVTGDAFAFSSEPLRNKMAIEVVRNVDVMPKYKSLYIGS